MGIRRTWYVKYREIWRGGDKVERVHRVCLSVPGDSLANLPAGREISLAAMRSLRREPCHDLIALTTTGRLPL